MENYPYLSISKIKSFLDSTGGAIRKKWGQNFLIDQNIIDIIINNISLQSIDKSELIVEIGPGLGALTHKITKFQKDVLLIEIDPILANNLRASDYIINDKIKLIEGDILENFQEFDNKKSYVIGNLPYYISSEIITGVLKNCKSITGGIFMLQKEFAERIEKDISSLSIFAKAFGDWKLVKLVKPNCFYPSPKASSAVLLFKPFENRLSDEVITRLELILRAFFWGKRKTISHIINYSPFLMETERGNLKEICNKIIGSDLKERPENIDFQTYYQLAKELSK